MANKRWDGNTVSYVGDYSHAANWSPSGVPGAADVVVIPSGSASITTGLDQSAVAITSFTVERGYSGTIGSATANLQLDTTGFTFSGTGLAYVDLGSQTVSPQIYNTATATTGNRGLYLIGTGIATLSVMGGKVGLAFRHGTSATATTVRVVGSTAYLEVGTGTTLTNAIVDSGELVVRCAFTTATVYSGTFTTEGTGAGTTINLYAGTVTPNSTGTITTINQYGGEVDYMASAAARTLTNYNPYPLGEEITFSYNPAIITTTTFNESTTPVTLTMTRA